MGSSSVTVRVATPKDQSFASDIAHLIEEAAKKRGTGIAKRDPAYLQDKMNQGKAVIALSQKGELAGFCYIETWQHNEYIANSGLIVHPDFQGMGLSHRIKKEIFNLSRRKFPKAKIFGITTSLQVMKVNARLGYQPVTFSELTHDEQFWKGCQGCVNYDILQRNEKKNCLCTGMLYEPDQQAPERKENNKANRRSIRTYYRWVRLKKQAMLNLNKKSKKEQT